jgi:hypothetical protein
MIPTPQLGIPSANRLSVSQNATQLPSMSSTVKSYFRPLVLIYVFKSVVNHEIQEARKELRCSGTIQPFDWRALRIKPEGQRSWNWQMLHTTPDVKLKNDEEFTEGGTRYRVMSQGAYSRYGFITYELVQDYDGRTN